MAQNHQAQLGSIPILEASVTVCRDIPDVLIGKMHWIEWSMFCDRLDESLKPLRDLVKPSSDMGGKSTKFRFRRRPVKTNVIKSLQRVCDQQARQQTLVIQDFILYCPLDKWNKALSVTNWHIQVVVKPSHQPSSSNSFGILDSVPTCISVPSTPTSNNSNSCVNVTQAAQWQSLSLPLDLPSHVATIRPPQRRFSSSRRNINHASGTLSASSSIATNEDDSHPTNPFLDDPNDSLAMSRDGLMELDGQMDWEAWGKVPTIPADVSHDQMPIPMPPPAPYAKVL